MRLEHHVALSAAVAGILMGVFHSWEMAVASLLPGIFLDVDHVADFLAQSRERFTIRRLFKVAYGRTLPKAYLVLHGWEWLFICGVLAWWTNANPWLFGLYLGWAQHMIADQFVNDAHGWSYFFFGRLLHRFDHLAAFPWPDQSFDFSRRRSIVSGKEVG